MSKVLSADADLEGKEVIKIIPSVICFDETLF